MDADINMQSEPTPNQWESGNVIAVAGLADETAAVLLDETGAQIQPD